MTSEAQLKANQKYREGLEKKGKIQKCYTIRAEDAPLFIELARLSRYGELEKAVKSSFLKGVKDD